METMTIDEMEEFRGALLEQLPPVDPPLPAALVEAYAQLRTVRRCLQKALADGSPIEVAGLLVAEQRASWEIEVLAHSEDGQ